MTDAVVGGPVPLNSGHYAERTFADEVMGRVRRREWVLVLGPRQHGKTSAMIRFKRDLRELGFRCGGVDLQRAPVLDTFEGFLGWFTQELAKSLGRDLVQPAAADRSQVAEWLRLNVPDDAPTVVLVDEASAIRDPAWRNVFYGQLRSLKNAVAEAEEGSLESRIIFVFAGTFDPDEILHRDNSPFNIVQNIDTDDLTLDAAKAMAAAIWGEADDVSATAAYDAVGGQPFLLQLLFDAVAAVPPSERFDAVAAEVARLHERGHEHLRSIFRMVIADPELVDVVARVANDGSTPFRAGNHKDKFLEILGLMRVDAGVLTFRNQLYGHSARTMVQIPGAGAPAQQAALPGAVYDYPEDAFDFIVEPELREIAFAAQSGAVACYRVGAYRLALAGFGVALEAALMDWITAKGTQAAEAAFDRALQRAGQNGDNWRNGQTVGRERNRPVSEWRLITLCKVARELPGVGGNIDIPDTIRDLRNCVHPAAMRARYQAEPALLPEALMSAGALAMVMRDLRAAP